MCFHLMYLNFSVGMCVLGLGAVCLIIGLWMCSSCFSLCCNKGQQGTVIATVEVRTVGEIDGFSNAVV